MISNTWNWVLEWRGGGRICENKHPVNIIQDHKHLLNSHTHTGPKLSSDEGFDVQIYWYVFRGDDRDSDTARQVLGTGMNNVALPLKYPLCEDEHRSYDSF